MIQVKIGYTWQCRSNNVTLWPTQFMGKQVFNATLCHIKRWWRGSTNLKVFWKAAWNISDLHFSMTMRPDAKGVEVLSLTDKMPTDAISNKLILKFFKCQSHKMVKHTQTIRRQFADELFECVWPFCGIGV